MDGYVIVVCEEELEGSVMVIIMEELFFLIFLVGSMVFKIFKWLLVNLLSLFYFDVVRVICCFILR